MSDSPEYSAFVEKLYGEVNDLLIEERDYVSGPQAEDSVGMEPQVRLRMTQELSAMTRRLTEIMAWLLVQKGVTAGEISAEEAATSAAAELFEGTEDEPLPEAELTQLPMAVRGMIDRSRRLYNQVVQLDDMQGQGD